MVVFLLLDWDDEVAFDAGGSGWAGLLKIYHLDHAL